MHRRVTEAKLQLFAEVASLMNSKNPPLEAQKINLSDPSFMGRSDMVELSTSQQQPADADMPPEREPSSLPKAKDASESLPSTNVKGNGPDSQPKTAQMQPIKLLVSKSKADAFLTSLNKSDDQIQSLNKSIRENAEETKELRMVMMDQLRKLQGSRC